MRRLASGRRRRRDDDDARVLPLVNVVFLLLVFFMVAGRLTAADPFAVEPPVSASEGQGEDGPILVLVGSDGRLALGAEPMAEPELVAAVAARLAAEPEAELRVKADAQAEAADVVALLGRLREAGAASVRLLTVPEAP